jgi:dolichol kinase
LNKKKSLEGAAFALVFLFFVMMLFLPVRYALLVSFVCVFLETIEFRVFGRVLDDNIYLPLIAGTMILLLNTL